ncbi:phospho-sugar mutase [Gordonia sinesedis]
MTGRLPADLADRVAAWQAADPDPVTRAELDAASPADLAERFAAPLRFGTAGLRGPVRAGPNGMNVAVVARATAGLARWLVDHGEGGGIVIVGHDARHGSAAFATVTAEVLAAAGFDVVTLPGPVPTPLVAFACRDLHAVAGVQITASHNPATDNGYKVYLDGGAQVIPPADREIEALIDAAPAANHVPRQPVSTDDRGVHVAARYLDRVTDRFPPANGIPDAGVLDGEVHAAQTSGDVARTGVRIALTAMHGVGGDLALAALHRAGFDDVHVVDEQQRPDPDFPTVAFPNPEEPGAADLLLRLAEAIDADIAIALDPDADRCAVGARVGGRWRMLTGDETGGLLGAYLLAQRETEPAPTATAGNGTDAVPVTASTIVSGSLLRKVADRVGARHVTTLTGFKWLVRAGEPLRYAYEEAIGHCVDPDAVRDKDGISAAVALARLTESWLSDNRSTGNHSTDQQMADDPSTDVDRGPTGLTAALLDLTATHGAHATTQRSIRTTDPAAIADIMARLRSAPPERVGGIAVTLSDYADRNDALRTDAVELRGRRTDGVTIRVMARGSGTEPKLKFYVEATAPPGFTPPGTGEPDDARPPVSATNRAAAATYPAAAVGDATRRAAAHGTATYRAMAYQAMTYQAMNHVAALADRAAAEMVTAPTSTPTTTRAADTAGED